MVSLAAACLLGTLALSAAPAITRYAGNFFGGGYSGGLAGEAVLAAAVLFLPTVVMGSTLTHLFIGARHAGGGIGAALGVNTLGGFLAPLLFGVVLLPGLGAKISLALLALAYLALLPTVNRQGIWALAGVTALLGFVSLASLQHVEPPPGGRTIEVRSGVMGTVAAVVDPQGNRFLKVNNHFVMGGTASAFPDRRLLLLPMLLHPAPRQALVLGIGTGVTLGAAAADPGMKTAGVELVGDVLKVMHHFEPENGLPDRLENVTLFTADARRFVRASSQHYDLVVGDLFHPARDGAGSLYTREHFEAIRDRLAPGGIYVQWLPLHQLDLEVFSVVCRTFLDVFPDAQALMAHFNAGSPLIGLIGETRRGIFSANEIEARLRLEPMHSAAEQTGIQNATDVLGCFIADAESLRAFADAHSAPTSVNTDDHPIVSFLAPRYAYEDSEPPAQRLETLLGASKIDFGGLGGSTIPVETLDRFTRARNIYLEAGSALATGEHERSLALLLEAVRTSPGFRPAYAQVLSEALAMSKSNRPGAVALLDRLIQADPSRMEALTLQHQILLGAQG